MSKRPFVVSVADSETILSRVVQSSAGLLWGDHRFTVAMATPSERKWLLPIGGPIGIADQASIGIAMSLATRQVTGVRLEDGSEVFQIPAPLRASLWADQIVTVTRKETLECFDSATGELVRTIALPWQPMSIGQRSGDLQWVVPRTPEGARDPRLCAVDLRTGVVAWERPLLDELRSSVLVPPLVDNVMHWLSSSQTSSDSISVFSHGGVTFGSRVVDGTIAWHAPYAIPGPEFFVRDGRVTFLTADHHHVSLDEATGAVIYEVDCSTELQGANQPGAGVVFNDTIAFPHQSGHLGVFNMNDGRLVDVRHEKEDLWSCAVVNSKLVVGTGSGHLLIFDESIWGA
jgi:outer membrane protein assembly factor BamB